MIKANAIPLYVEVRDVFVPDASGSDAVHVRKVRVYINPFPLLWRKISLPSVTLLEPHVRSTRNAAGDLSLVQMADRIRTAAGKRKKEGASRFTVDPGTITVQRGTIAFLDEATETTLSVSGLAMNVRFRAALNNIGMSVQSASVRIAAKAQPALTFDLRGRAEYRSDKLTLTDLELLAPDGKITASGSMGTGPDGSLDLTLKGRFGQQTLGRFSALLNKKTAKGQRPLIDLAVTAKAGWRSPLSRRHHLYNIPYKAFTVQEAGLAFSYRDNLLSLTGSNGGSQAGPAWSWTASRHSRSSRSGFRHKNWRSLPATSSPAQPAVSMAQKGMTRNSALSPAARAARFPSSPESRWRERRRFMAG
jgi:hypothetical protein